MESKIYSSACSKSTSSSSRLERSTAPQLAGWEAVAERNHKESGSRCADTASAFAAFAPPFLWSIEVWTKPAGRWRPQYCARRVAGSQNDGVRLHPPAAAHVFLLFRLVSHLRLCCEQKRRHPSAGLPKVAR